MTIKTVRRWIRINPYYICSSLYDHIFIEIEKQMKNQCDETNGHVIEIINVIKIIDNQIQNSSSDVVVFVEFDIDVFKPVAEMVVDTVICAIYADGILVESHGIQKILIPASTYAVTHTFDDNKLTRDNKIISQGDNLSVLINAVRYDDHKFSCLGVIA
jgi:DNA-directed RNA polymerase subunit E'/Rpb7